MSDNLLKLRMTDQAEFGYSTLGSEDRRRVDAWLDHLRNWRNDTFLRTQAQPLKSSKDSYVLPTSTDLAIVFELAGDEVIVHSLHLKDTLRKFGALARQTAP